MKKSVKKCRILAIICVAALVSCNSAISAEVVNNKNFSGIPDEFNTSSHGYIVTENIEWQEDGSLYSLNAGDVIGICENKDNVRNRSVGEITAEHYGGREY